jgi:AraC-like DNA-binding protein
MTVGETLPPEPLLAARTREVPPEDQFSYFCDALCAVYLGIRTEWAGRGAFDAEFSCYDVGPGVLAHMWAPGTTGRRGRDLVRQRPDEAFYLNFSASAGHRLSHLDQHQAVPAAVPVLLDSEAPFAVDFSDQAKFRLFSLRIEKSPGFAPTADLVRQVNARMTTTVVGRQLAAPTRMMCAELQAGRPRVAAAMSVPVLALLTALAGGGEAAGPRRLDELTAAARARLGDPGFGVAELAAAFGVSARTVQSTFHAAGETFTGWLLAERLELARDRLTAPAWSARSIIQIATACGFRDPAHFHRAFRARFAATPGDFRPRLPRGDRRQVPDLLLGDVEPDSVRHGLDRADRDGDLLASPQVALLEDDVGHALGAVHHEALYVPDLAVDGVDVLVPLNLALAERNGMVDHERLAGA